MAKHKPKKEADKLKLRDLFLPIQPRLFDVLFKLAGARTAGDFAGRAKPGDDELDQKLLGKYRKGTTLALHNLPGIAKRTCGLSLGNLAWLIGFLMVEHYKRFEIALPEQAGEIREPQPRYGELRLPDEQIESVMTSELKDLDPEDMVNLNLTRRALRGTLEGLRDGLKSILEAIAAWEKSYSTARHRARHRS